MSPTEAQEIRAVFNAFAEGKAIEWQEKSGGSWMRCAGGLFSFDSAIRMGQKVRIAKERQTLPRLGDAGGGHQYECYLDTDGLHVGCTTISFERVGEIAQACRKWQDGGNGEVKTRRDAWVLTRKSYNNDDLGWAFPTKQKAEDGARNNVDTTGMLHMREVLPGEDDV